MTAVCVSGGTSSPKPGVEDTLVYAAGATSLFSFAGDFAPLALLAPLIGNLVFHTPSFCAADPPAMPSGFTVQELLDLTTSTYSADYISGLAKLTDVAKNVGWYALCKCDAGAQPTPSAAPTPPTGAPVAVGPGYGNNVDPCATAGGIFTATPVTGGFGFVDFVGTTSFGTAPFFESPLPPDAHTIHLVMTNHISGAVPDTFKMSGAFSIGNKPYSTYFPSVPGTIGNYNILTGTSQTVDIPVPPGATGWVFGTTFVAHPNVTNHPEVQASVYCGQAPGQAITACCPPDANMLLLLNQINTAVTLIQRQIAPFATVHGTAHTGLSGNGQFAVSGILGLAVDLTTTPSRLGVQAGDPDTIWNAGWINVGTSDGWGPRHFITSDPFILRPVDGDATLVGYSIPADVSITIVEIVREP